MQYRPRSLALRKRKQVVTLPKDFIDTINELRAEQYHGDKHKAHQYNKRLPK